MTEPDQHLKLKNTPGGVIASYAFNYAVKFYDFAAVKYPELKAYPPDHRYAMHQAAIVVAALILMERGAAGAGSSDLHDNVARAFPPSARRRCLTAVLSLSSLLLQQSLPPEGIPSYAPLAGADDNKLAGTIGSWLALSIMNKRELAPAELPLAAAMARSAWTSAVMIVRLLQNKNKR